MLGYMDAMSLFVMDFTIPHHHHSIDLSLYLHASVSILLVLFLCWPFCHLTSPLPFRSIWMAESVGFWFISLSLSASCVSVIHATLKLKSITPINSMGFIRYYFLFVAYIQLPRMHCGMQCVCARARASVSVFFRSTGDVTKMWFKMTMPIKSDYLMETKQFESCQQMSGLECELKK